MCDTPFYKKIDGYINDIPLPCGKCPPCKHRRVNDWTFRLQQEDKISLSSYFVTLTYDTRKVPISSKGYMTLNKRDCQLFMKRLRKLSKNKLKYYLAGEYGDTTNRPHYHMILFNLEDETFINDAWQNGSIHVGKVSGDSIAYTCKYIDKQKRIPLHINDDRVPEFSLMSRKLGENYLNKQNIAWHKADITRNYIVKEGGFKIALPRYYRERIYNTHEKSAQRFIINLNEKEKYEKLVIKSKNGVTPEEMLHNQKLARYNRFYNTSKKLRQ